jgi:hypothetical protein
MLAETSMFCSLRHGLPDNLLWDGNVGAPVVDRAGEQISKSSTFRNALTLAMSSRDSEVMIY